MTGSIFAELFRRLRRSQNRFGCTDDADFDSAPFASLYEVLGGLLVGSLFGIPLGILFGSRRSFMQVMEPMILYLAVVPKIIVFRSLFYFSESGRTQACGGRHRRVFSHRAADDHRNARGPASFLDVGLSARVRSRSQPSYLPAIAGYVFTGLQLDWVQRSPAPCWRKRRSPERGSDS